MSSLSVECKFLTDEFIKEWKSATGNGPRLPSSMPPLTFIYELSWMMIKGELPFQKGKVMLDSAEFPKSHSKEQLGSVFADVVAHMALDFTMPGEYRARFIKMAKWLVESAIVPLRLFQERCEEEFLWESEMIKMRPQDLKAKEVRVNTRLLYQQTKFNLLREESEGYAKLVTLLSQLDSKAYTQSTADAVTDIIKSLIGQFDLDPNRVFDIVLECFELQPKVDIFFKLIPIFPKSHAAQILGSKFQFYQRMEVTDCVPLGLYQLTALLVQLEFIDLNSICEHLLPKDEEAFEHYEGVSARRFEEANKIGKINLAAIGKDLMDEEKQGDVSIDLYAALDMESEAVEESFSELGKNQSLGLLNGFLSVGDWYHGQILFGRLAPINPIAHPPTCDALFRLIEKTIAPGYSLVHHFHNRDGGMSMSDMTEASKLSLKERRSADLPKELFQMLSYAGPYLHRDIVLLQKVCRVLRGYYIYAQECEVASNGSFDVAGDYKSPCLQLKEARLRVEEALGTCILPSLQLIPANPAVGMEIWEVMCLLPYEVRYRLYGEWEKDDERIPMVLAARQTAKLDTRRVLKRLAKENLKQLGRMVAKLAHANPMTVLRTIVHQIEAYKDMIAPVVDAFKYLTQLEYDILEYVVIERLAQGGREKLKEDGLNLSDWLQSLASFWGHLCKKYPSMELRGLFQYLANQLKKGSGIELVVLQELIQQMANVQYTENMTEEQLNAMGGGETLRYQATSYGITRNNKALTRSSSRLRDSLLPKDEPKLAVPLLLLIAQHRSMVVINADAHYIKVVSEQFDRCHGSLLQYVDFLSSAVISSAAYAQLIPTLDHLVHKYHLEPEVAFLIYRPVMKLFKSSVGSEVFWPADSPEVTDADGDKNLDCSPNNLILDLGSLQEPLLWSDLLGTIRSVLPSKAWNSLSPDLYATFWGLTLYDLHVPKDRYDSEIAKQHSALKALEELPDNSNSAITKRKKEKERIQEVLDRLTSEYQKHEAHVSSVHRRLSREKDIWLTSCPDTLKINMEFLQRCIFPRCTFSMVDAAYCAKFVHTLHSLGTPFFNTVNHIDVLICKTLQPMICCCTEYEAGRLGRFLYDTLKMAYHWKSDESVYERECGNMPGFAVYYRDPNSQRVTFGQFVRVHWKWSQRISKLLIQCMESTEYMEIRNALITLTKISSVFPVMRKSGVNIEKRVLKIKGDEREDLKVLATGVAAALAARKSSWVSEEEFCMGFVDLLKRAPSPAKHLVGNVPPVAGLSTYSTSQNGNASRNASGQFPDAGNTVKDHTVRSKYVDGRPERSENVSLAKHDGVPIKAKTTTQTSNADGGTNMPAAAVQHGSQRPPGNGISKNLDEAAKGAIVEEMMKGSPRVPVEPELRAQAKCVSQTSSTTKQVKQEVSKDDVKPSKAIARASLPVVLTNDRETTSSYLTERQGGSTPVSKTQMTSSKANFDSHTSSVKVDGAARLSESRVTVVSDLGDVQARDAPHDVASRSSASPLASDYVQASKTVDKQQKRPVAVDENDRLSKRRKGEGDVKDMENQDSRLPERDRAMEQRFTNRNHDEYEKGVGDDQNHGKSMEKPMERTKEKINERLDRDVRGRVERAEKPREDAVADKSRDRSTERHGREKSVDRVQDRSLERTAERGKDDRNKDDRMNMRYVEPSNDKSHPEDRFHGQSLPPPPPLPPNVVPQSLPVGRRDEDPDRRIGSARYVQHLSPRHEDKERRRSEENVASSLDDSKRRREDDFRERKRDEREALPLKIDEREKDKGSMLKEDIDVIAASKKRRLKRDHLPSETGNDYSLSTPPPLVQMGSTPSHDPRERNDRKLLQRTTYAEEPIPRMHPKDALTKIPRRDTEPIHDRDWDDDKRQRAELKRRHRK